MQIRYTNDFGDGTSGYADYGSGIVVTTLSGQPLPVTTQSNSPATDAFGRLRTSAPFTLFDSILGRTKRTDLWDERTVGSGSTNYLINESSLELKTTTASGDSVLRRSFKYFPS